MIERREETDVEERTDVEEGGLDGRRRAAFLLDLALYLAVMFLVRVELRVDVGAGSRA